MLLVVKPTYPVKATDLMVAFGVSVCLIYLILATQFGSYLQPFLIMSNIIFSFTGVLLVMGVIGGVLLIVPDGVVRPERADANGTSIPGDYCSDRLGGKRRYCLDRLY